MNEMNEMNERMNECFRGASHTSPPETIAQERACYALQFPVRVLQSSSTLRMSELDGWPSTSSPLGSCMQKKRPFACPYVRVARINAMRPCVNNVLISSWVHKCVCIRFLELVA